MPTPVFNIIKRAITYFVASITSSNVAINLEPLAYNDDDGQPGQEAADIATAEIENLFEKFKMEKRIRDALFDAATMGDVAAHFYFDPSKKPYRGAFDDVLGEICMELVDGSSVFFGNANNPSTDVNIQPYIIVQGRDMVENLKAEAKQYRAKQAEIDGITSDKDYNYMAGDMGKIEIESDEYGKATYIIVYKYDRKTQTVKVSKCTATAYMYKDVDTGLNHYPVAWLVWERQKNQYHGRAMCTGLIPNQIFINKMFAMVMYHLMMTAFPKAVYDANKIPTWSNEVGQAIPLRNLQPGDSIKNFAGYLEPGNMSNQIVNVIDLAIRYTKDTLGINDSALGDINPEQASGVAIATTVKQASIPLENTKANLYEWVEDIGRILLDMMGTYYGLRPVILTQDGEKVPQMFDFSIFKNLWLTVKCDVGPSSYWSEIASVQTLDNLLSRNDPLFTMIDYLEALPDGYISDKQALVDKLKERIDQQAVQQNEQFEQMAQWLEQQPPEVQQQLMSLPEGEQEQAIMQMMNQAPQEGVF